MLANPATMDRNATPTVDPQTRLFVLWMLFAVFCQCAGWGLSAIHQLNAAGYIVAFVLFFVAAAVWMRRAFPGMAKPFFPKHRFRRPFPVAFLILTALAVLGGALYLPNNFDAHAYRTPRVLHWLAEGRWHWIHSHFGNLNVRGAAFEWITAPLFLFTKTDRLEFLINAICFLFVPGRIFAVLTRLGVRRRVAYYWMWIFPTAYGFILQAGSIGNDLFTALWPMTAIEFALRAREMKRVEYVWLSGFAAALMTASKAFGLLLLPAWGISILPALGLLLRRPVGSIVAMLIAAAASMIPTALLNLHYCGDWTGIAAEPVRLIGGPPVFQIVVNFVLIVLTNLAPPIFPFSGAWDRFVHYVVPAAVQARVDQYFEPDAARFRIAEMPGEESAGLGFGVSILLLLIVVRQLTSARSSSRNLFSLRNFIALAALGGALIFMAQSGLYAPARYLLPLCFPIVIPILALPAAFELTLKDWWRRLALALFALAALLLIVAPARPLFPAQTLLSKANVSARPLLQRAAEVYAIYRDRADLLRPIRETLPASAKIIGLISFNEPETSLWRPFGSRRILHIRSEDSPEFTRSRGIQYVVIERSAIALDYFKTTPEEWARKNNGEMIARFSIKMLARGKPMDWVLVRLNP
jgi:hypothetical protein